MNPNTIVDHSKTKFEQALDNFKDELKKIRTGRAHPNMLDGVMVEAYGTAMPLLQVGSVTVPEPQLLQITPFDPNNLQAIAQAIRDNQSLGFNPTDDGRVVRIQIPPLTEERRRDLVKVIGAKAEEAMIRMRNARHDALKDAENAKRDREITEDDLTSIKKRLDELIAKYKGEIDSLVRAKETDILTV